MSELTPLVPGANSSAPVDPNSVSLFKQQITNLIVSKNKGDQLLHP
jgi:hypothetical protein